MLTKKKNYKSLKKRFKKIVLGFEKHMKKIMIIYNEPSQANGFVKKYLK